MSRIPGAALLLALVLPVWGVGQYLSMKEAQKQSKRAPHHRWMARYGKLAPHLEGVPRAGFVRNPKTRPRHKHRFYKAQYVLAPTVLTYLYRLPEPRPKRLRGEPVIYDFKNPRALTEVLAETEAKAAARGISLQRVRVAKGLVLARMSKE